MKGALKPEAAAALIGEGASLMVMVATARHRIAGLCLNDVGLERPGLERIGAYVAPPAVTTLAKVADRLAAANPGFDRMPPFRWLEETARRYTATADGVGLTYDPALKIAFDDAMAAPPVDLWPLFSACDGLPLALIRGANSDVLSAATAHRMRGLRPDLGIAEVPGRGHVPFLDEPEALQAVSRWLDRVRHMEAAATPVAADPISSGT